MDLIRMSLSAYDTVYENKKIKKLINGNEMNIQRKNLLCIYIRLFVMKKLQNMEISHRKKKLKKCRMKQKRTGKRLKSMCHKNLV